jgi:hypothetical protein
MRHALSIWLLLLVTNWIKLIGQWICKGTLDKGTGSCLKIMILCMLAISFAFLQVA